MTYALNRELAKPVTSIIAVNKRIGVCQCSKAAKGKCCLVKHNVLIWSILCFSGYEMKPLEGRK